MEQKKLESRVSGDSLLLSLSRGVLPCCVCVQKLERE